jgi:hypothetical protein
MPSNRFPHPVCLVRGVCLFIRSPARRDALYAVEISQRLDWLVPKPLLQNTSPAAGPKRNYFGVEFDSAVLDVKEERKFKSAVVLSFDDCSRATFFEPSEPSFQLTAARRAEKPGKTIESVFGREGAASDYALRSKTPQSHTCRPPSVLLALRHVWQFSFVDVKSSRVQSVFKTASSVLKRRGTWLSVG